MSHVKCPRKRRKGAEVSVTNGRRYKLTLGKQVFTLLAPDAATAHKRFREIVKRELPHTELFGSSANTKEFLDKWGTCVGTVTGFGVTNGRKAVAIKRARVARTAARIAKYGA